MSAVEPIFPRVPTPSATPVVEATQVIETIGVEVLENTPYTVLDDQNKTVHANDVIPYASTLQHVG
jgi:hypothetical protein